LFIIPTTSIYYGDKIKILINMDGSKKQYIYPLLSAIVGIILGITKIYWIIGILTLSIIQIVIVFYEYKIRKNIDKKMLLNVVIENVGLIILFWSISSTVISQ